MISELTDSLLEFLPLISIVISTITLIFLSYQSVLARRQTRNNSTSTIASLYEHVAGRMMEIDRTFVTFPELRPHFYANVPVKGTKTEQQRILALAETFLDFMDLVIVLKEITESFNTSRVFQHHISEWGNYFADIYKTSPAIRQCLGEHPEWYNDHLQKILEGKRIRK